MMGGGGESEETEVEGGEGRVDAQQQRGEENDDVWGVGGRKDVKTQ